MIQKQPYYINENNLWGEVICSLMQDNRTRKITNTFNTESIPNRYLINDNIQLLIKYSLAPELDPKQKNSSDKYLFEVNLKDEILQYFSSDKPIFLALLAIHSKKLIQHRIFYLPLQGRSTKLLEQEKTIIELLIKKDSSPKVLIHNIDSIEEIETPWSKFPDILFG